MSGILSYGLKSASSKMDDDYMRSGTRVYLVQATTGLDEFQVRVAFPIQIYNTHPSDLRQIVVGVSIDLFAESQALFFDPTNEANPNNGTAVYLWTATVEYGPWNPLEHTDTGDPSAQPVKVLFEGQTFQEVLDVDINGNPVVNTAFDPFDPPLERDRTRPVLKVVRNEDSFTPSTILGYADKVNSDVVGPYPVRTLKVSCPIGEPKFSQFTGNVYYEVTYMIHYNPDTWDFQPLNQGLRELDPASATNRRMILTEDGQPASAPVLLDAYGHALNPPITSSTVIFLQFQGYETISFAASFSFPSGTFT